MGSRVVLLANDGGPVRVLVDRRPDKVADLVVEVFHRQLGPVEEDRLRALRVLCQPAHRVPVDGRVGESGNVLLVHRHRVDGGGARPRVVEKGQVGEGRSGGYDGRRQRFAFVVVAVHVD